MNSPPLPASCALPVIVPLPFVTEFDLEEVIFRAILGRSRQVVAAEVLECLKFWANAIISRSKSVDRPISRGDIAVVKFKASVLKGQQPDINPTESFWMEQERFLLRVDFLRPLIPGSQHLLGLRRGDRKRVPIRFANAFLAANLAEKELLYDIDVIDVRAVVPFDSNANYGIRLYDHDLQRLPKSLQSTLRQVLYARYEFSVRDKLLHGLVSTSSVIPAASAIRRQFTAIASFLCSQFDREPFDRQHLNHRRDAISSGVHELARQVAKAQAALKQIGRQQMIRVEKAELQTAIHDYAARLLMTPTRLYDELKRLGSIGELAHQILREKTLRNLVRDSKVTKTAAKFDTVDQVPWSLSLAEALGRPEISRYWQLLAPPKGLRHFLSQLLEPVELSRHSHESDYKSPMAINDA